MVRILPAVPRLAIIVGLVVSPIAVAKILSPSEQAPSGVTSKVATLEAIPSGSNVDRLSSGLRDVRLQPSADLIQPMRPDTSQIATVRPELTVVMARAEAKTEAQMPDRPSVARKAVAVSESGAMGCTGYKTYDARSQTYRAYNGQVKPCRPKLG